MCQCHPVIFTTFYVVGIANLRYCCEVGGTTSCGARNMDGIGTRMTSPALRLFKSTFGLAACRSFIEMP